MGICLSAFILNTEIFLHVNKTAFSGHFRVFPTDDSPLKMLYLAMMDITKKQKGTGRTGVRFIPSWRFILMSA